MPDKHRAKQNDNLSLPIVDEPALKRFEHESPDVKQLYDRLYARNPELALHIRRRAVEIAPDIADRLPVAQLALELAYILDCQVTIKGLNELFAGPVAESDSTIVDADPAVLEETIDHELPPAA